MVFFKRLKISIEVDRIDDYKFDKWKHKIQIYKKGGVIYMKDTQKMLVNNLKEVLIKINEEAIEDDDFYNWLNNNYFFKEDLLEIIIKLKKAEAKI